MPQELVNIPSYFNPGKSNTPYSKMKRNPRKLKWTKAFRKTAGKEMTVDPSLLFEARRNVPVRYNRELVEKTTKAMARVREIRAKRERVFYKKRMEGNRERQKAADRKLVAENEHLLPRMRASERMALEAAREANGEMETVEEVYVEKAKVFGKMQQRLKVRIDDEIEEDGMDMD
jgi:large subunit ribosomal protein L24e